MIELAMVGLVGVAGFGGAGKTTAVRYLSEITGGQVIYMGVDVLEEIRARGLPETRDNEKQIRIELREEHGPAVLARRYASKAAEYLANGLPVFIDAIFGQVEFDVFRSCAPEASAYLLAIEASFDVRCARLIRRVDRPVTRHELEERDRTELEGLGTGAVISGASHTIRNEDSLDDFYWKLADFLRTCSSTPARSV